MLLSAGSPAGPVHDVAAEMGSGRRASAPPPNPGRVLARARGYRDASLLPHLVPFHVLRLSLSLAPPPSLHVTLARHCPRTHAVAAAAVTASYALTCRSYEEFITHSGPVCLLAPVSRSRINGGNEK